jgi:hypothetical protein
MIRPVTRGRNLRDKGISNIERIKVLPAILPGGKHAPLKLTSAEKVREAYTKRNNLESRALFS